MLIKRIREFLSSAASRNFAGVLLPLPRAAEIRCAVCRVKASSGGLFRKPGGTVEYIMTSSQCMG